MIIVYTSYCSSVQFSSVAQSCLTLCEPMDCSMPGLPVHHQLPEFTQIHVHWVSDAIQPAHPLSSPSPPAFILSQHQGLFQRVSSSHCSKDFAFNSEKSKLRCHCFPLSLSYDHCLYFGPHSLPWKNPGLCPPVSTSEPRIPRLRYGESHLCASKPNAAIRMQIEKASLIHSVVLKVDYHHNLGTC